MLCFLDLWGELDGVAVVVVINDLLVSNMGFGYDFGDIIIALFNTTSIPSIFFLWKIEIMHISRTYRSYFILLILFLIIVD